MVFLRVRIITCGGEATSSATIPSRLGWAAMPMTEFDRRGVDVMALVEAVVEADQHIAGARRGVGFALDLDAVAARRDVHAQALLDGDQMAVVIAEQRPEQIGLLELQLEPGAVAGGVRRRRGGPSGGLRLARTAPRQAVGQRGGQADVEHRRRSAHRWSTNTDCSHGDLPIIWPGWRPMRSIRMRVSRADAGAVEGPAVLGQPAPAGAAAGRP